MTLSLDFLPATAFTFFIIFARIGALTMALPGIGDRTVPMQIRLTLALVLTFVLYPAVQSKLPGLPQSMPGLIGVFVSEMVLGGAIGLSVRFIFSGLQVATSVIAVQTGLAAAQIFDPTQGVQASLFASFFSMLALVMIFSMDLHHLFLTAMHDSYQLFPTGQVFPAGDFAELVVTMVMNGFSVAMQLASPFLVFGLIFNLGLGILARLIPQVQVFFVAMPANIFFGFVLLMLLLSTIMLWYLDYVGNAIQPFLL